MEWSEPSSPLLFNLPFERSLAGHSQENNEEEPRVLDKSQLEELRAAWLIPTESQHLALSNAEQKAGATLFHEDSLFKQVKTKTKQQNKQNKKTKGKSTAMPLELSLLPRL